MHAEPAGNHSLGPCDPCWNRSHDLAARPLSGVLERCRALCQLNARAGWKMCMLVLAVDGL